MDRPVVFVRVRGAGLAGPAAAALRPVPLEHATWDQDTFVAIAEPAHAAAITGALQSWLARTTDVDDVIVREDVVLHEGNCGEADNSDVSVIFGGFARGRSWAVARRRP